MQQGIETDLAPPTLDSPTLDSPNLAPNLARNFGRDGFATAITVMSEAEAAGHRAALERAEETFGRSMHYALFPNLLFRSPDSIIRNPAVLDAVETVLGADIMVYECSYLIKEPGSVKRVSWHQDLTYWGLDTDEILTAWIALSPASKESGCMRMIPGSHRIGAQKHEDLREEDNILARGQTIQGVDEKAAISLPLEPGEMSLHHGWTMHASHPNVSQDRRIGFGIVFMTPRVQQKVQSRENAILVRGDDKYGHYDLLPPTLSDFDPELVVLRAEIDRRRNETWQTD